MVKTVKAKPNQTIYDLALEQYGTSEAVGEILSNNPSLRNDTSALMELGIETIGIQDFYLDVSLEPGIDIVIDTAGTFMQPAIVKEIKHDITTYNHGA